ncbi:hypothetical protein PTSG_00407 [Salpingoeca rosetta]|uniref:Uncharacterized protein n=1 Tax=Salpingoeca rosetta (strain ATCC 50818 / BSB-021) TaxID=946362 RepID=F2TWE0_SALR5|nr:uncharacterized protein PTSG_00407 [Salpingoeca rosetta]EGD72386.1 hypothetical protein PTSG_00407 [Salpingoeca rosetta]|eukprot:XP_004998955.1 hypothetical protein PTSG_00407 [Salpingoeca rosetta]
MCLVLMLPAWLVASPQAGGLIPKELILLLIAYLVYIENVCYRCLTIFVVILALLCYSGACHLCPPHVPCEPRPDATAVPACSLPTSSFHLYSSLSFHFYCPAS